MIQYFENIDLDVFHKIIPVICGIPILYYIIKKWQSRITVEDNYQHIINEKNNTTQSVITSITFYDHESINTINYDTAYKKLEEYAKDYNKLSANKINDIYLFKEKKRFP